MSALKWHLCDVLWEIKAPRVVAALPAIAQDDADTAAGEDATVADGDEPTVNQSLPPRVNAVEMVS